MWNPNWILPSIVAGQLVVIAGLTLALLLVSRRRRRETTLLRQQIEVNETTLRRFMEESEKTFLEFSRLLTRLNSRQEEVMKKLPESTDSSCSNDLFSDSMPGLSSLSSGFGSGKKKEHEKKDRVVSMANQGMTTEEISRKLDIPRGEIELILNLMGGSLGRESRN